MEATITLFGFPSTQAHLEVLSRSLLWRGLRASAFAISGAVLAPVMGMAPPHAPWALLTLSGAGFLGLRKWRERFTILAFEGSCPKCGGALSIRQPPPLRAEMTVPCPGCPHDSRLTPNLLPDKPDPGETP